MVTLVRHFQARARRLRERIPALTSEKCHALAADARTAADIAAFMGDDLPSSDFLHDLADELEEAATAKEKEARNGRA